jgi:hypothetical protein
MLLAGSLQDLNIVQISSLVSLAKKTGTLVIFKSLKIGANASLPTHSMSSGRVLAKIAFVKGEMSHAWMDGYDSDLITLLVKASKMTDQRAINIRQRLDQGGRPISEKTLAMRLISAEFVTSADVAVTVQQRTLGIIYALKSVDRGQFRFDDDLLPSKGEIFVPVTMSDIIEFIGRMEQLQGYLPNLNIVPQLIAVNEAQLKRVQLNTTEWRVLALVDRRRSVFQIGQLLKLTENEMRSAFMHLEQAGLILFAGVDANTDETQPRSPFVKKVDKAATITSLMRRVDPVN